MIHCVEELDQEIDPEVLEFINESQIDKIVNIVVHKHNSHLVSRFLNKYDNIQFEINFADGTFTDVNQQYSKEYNYAIDQCSSVKTIKELGNVKGYSVYTDFLTRRLIQNDFRNLNSWSSKNHD